MGVPGVSLSASAGDGFSKGHSDALEFVAGLGWAAAEGLGFGGSGYINVRNKVRGVRYQRLISRLGQGPC